MYVHQFWGAWSFRFRRYCHLQKRPNFPFGAWTIVHGHQKIQSIGIGSKNVKCIHTNFGGCGLFSFGDIATFKNGQFMQVGIDVKYMQTNFGGRGLFGFGDIAHLKKQPNFPFGAWTIVHGHQKI